MIKKVRIQFKGLKPLIMDNGMSANPVDPREMPSFLQTSEHKLFRTATKAITGKRGKTEQDFEKLSKLDFYSSLYLNSKNQVIIPSDCIEAAILSQAKENKLGTLVKRAVSVPDDALLNFPNKKKSLKDLYKAHAYKTLVKVSMSKTPNTRAIFNQWSFDTVIEFVPKLIDKQQVLDILALGKYYGFLSRRPKFGRYEVKELK